MNLKFKATSKNWKNAHCHFERSAAQPRNLFKKADFSTPPASRASVEMTANTIFRDTLKIENLKFVESPAASFIKFLYELIIFSFILVLGGCGMQKRTCPPIATTIEATKLLQEYAGNAKPIKATGDCSLSYINEKGEKFSQSFPVRIWLETSNKFCLYGDVMFDPKGVCFAVNNGKYWTYAKPLKVFMKGEINPVSDNIFTNPTLLVDFLRPEGLDCENGTIGNDILHCEKDGCDNKKIYFDKCGRNVKKIEYFNCEKKPVRVVEAEDYKKVDKSNFYFPNKLIYKYSTDSKGSNRMEIKLGSVKLWQPTTEQLKALFTMPDANEIRI